MWKSFLWKKNLGWSKWNWYQTVPLSYGCRTQWTLWTCFTFYFILCTSFFQLKYTTVFRPLFKSVKNVLIWNSDAFYFLIHSFFFSGLRIDLRGEQNFQPGPVERAVSDPTILVEKGSSGQDVKPNTSALWWRHSCPQTTGQVLTTHLSPKVFSAMEENIHSSGSLSRSNTVCDTWSVHLLKHELT